MGPVAPLVENLAMAQADPRLVTGAARLARASSAFVICAGAVVLLGWTFDVGVLKSVVPGLATMTASTALGFVLPGTALRLLPLAVEARVRSAAVAAAVAAIVLGLLNVGQDIARADLGIDQLLFADPDTPPSQAPGRMSPATALSFVAIGA